MTVIIITNIIIVYDVTKNLFYSQFVCKVKLIKNENIKV